MGGQTSIGGIAPENALDALLDELQTFAKPPNHNDQLQVDLVAVFECRMTVFCDIAVI